MNYETFDKFLDDAIRKVSERWEEAGGSPMSLDEKHALNDLLTALFGDKLADEINEG